MNQLSLGIAFGINVPNYKGRVILSTQNQHLSPWWLWS